MKMIVTGGNLNIRREPDISSEITHILADGEIIDAGKEKAGWCSCGSGYVMAKYLAPYTDPEASEVVDAIKENTEAVKEVKKEVKKSAKKTKKADK